MADYCHVDHDSNDNPEWGSLPFDCYLIDKWNSDTADSPEKRAQLVRDYVALGCAGRSQYKRQAEEGKFPTPEQIAKILEPQRAPAFRAAAKRLISEKPVEFVWLRTHYGNETEHLALVQDLVEEETDFGENMAELGIILHDQRYYDWGDDWSLILDVLPEILDIADNDINDTERQQKLKEDYDRSMEDTLIYGDKAEFVTQPEKRYATMTARAHNRCIRRVMFVEDAQTYTTDPATFHALWLDSRGAVSRRSRSTAEHICLYLTDETRAISCDSSVFTIAEIGPDYRMGGKYGPPSDWAARFGAWN